MFWYTRLKITLSCAQTPNADDCCDFRGSSIFYHVPDPGAKLWNSRVHSGSIPVATADPPADDPSKLPPSILSLTRKTSEKCFQDSVSFLKAYLDHHGTSAVPLTTVLPAWRGARTHEDLRDPLILTRIPGHMFSSMWTFVYYLYILMHLLFDMIGSWTSRRTGDICPYSDNLPQPVTVPTWK